MCGGTIVNVDLYDVVQQAKAFDQKLLQSRNSTTTTTTKKGGAETVITVPPTGFVFHETRCGSTLTANLLAGFAPPDQSRVFSESPPPVTALRACDMNPCNPSLHIQLIRDVVYMMGRKSIHTSQLLQKKKDPHYLFFKIQSIGVMNIDKFTEAFPDVPWMYLYRDSVEIMQSHWKDTSKQRNPTPVCARNFNNPRQPPTTLQILDSKPITDVTELTKKEYCAAHLVRIKQWNRNTRGGWFINGCWLTYYLLSFVFFFFRPVCPWRRFKNTNGRARVALSISTSILSSKYIM
jgi:hypothetical protein